MEVHLYSKVCPFSLDRQKKQGLYATPELLLGDWRKRKKKRKKPPRYSSGFFYYTNLMGNQKEQILPFKMRGKNTRSGLQIFLMYWARKYA